MAAFTPAGSGGIPTPVVSDDQITSYSILNTVVAAENSETTITIPATCVWFSIQNRNGARIQLAHTAGQSGTTFSTIWPGNMPIYRKKSGQAMLIYIQCAKPNTTVEVELGHV